MRGRLVAAGVAALMVLGGTVAYGAAASQDVACTITDNTLTCPLPAPPAPVTETVTAAPVTVTAPAVTVTKTVTAAPTTSSPVTTAPTTTAAPTTTTSAPAGGFPDASTTGYRGALTARSGIVTLGNNAVLENTNLTGSVVVSGTGVIIRNSKITSTAFWPIRSNGTVTITDVTVVASPSSQSCAGGPGMTILRMDCSGAPDGLKLDANSSVTDSYLHDFGACSGCHYDGIEVWDDNVKIIHNTVLNKFSQTSAIFVGDDQDNVLVQDNLMAGGGYTFYGRDGHGTAPTNVVVKGNVWSKRYYPKGGGYGPVTFWSAPSNTWGAGNRWEDGTPVNP